jgi:peptide/nickel transport system substrate-binding protein
LPPGTLGYVAETSDTATSSEARIAEAKQILADGGWKYNESKGVMEKTINKKVTELSFAISTSAVPELKSTAQALRDTWQALGASVDVKVFETGNLDQSVIRPRDYDALLFGEIIARDSDPFAFWDSSQRLDPGLNISSYANTNVDKLLEKARTTIGDADRAEMYETFAETIEKDVPAAFLYAPDFLYLVPDRIKGIELASIAIPSDRFNNIYEWYINTQNIWSIFTGQSH